MDSIKKTSKRRQLSFENNNIFLGKKRNMPELQENFLFRSVLTNYLEGEYEKAAHNFKFLFCFDWDDEKVVKPKMHPSK